MDKSESMSLSQLRTNPFKSFIEFSIVKVIEVGAGYILKSE